MSSEEGSKGAEAQLVTSDKMVRGGLSGFQAGASLENEAEEKHTTGSKSTGPEA